MRKPDGRGNPDISICKTHYCNWDLRDKGKVWYCLGGHREQPTLWKLENKWDSHCLELLVKTDRRKEIPPLLSSHSAFPAPTSASNLKPVADRARKCNLQEQREGCLQGHITVTWQFWFWRWGSGIGWGEFKALILWEGLSLQDIIQSLIILGFLTGIEFTKFF